MPKVRVEHIGDAVLYLGDCLELLPTIESTFGKVDAVVTDPPYGIASVWKGGGGHGWAKARYEGVTRNKWDMQAPAPEIFHYLLKISREQIFWGGNYFQLPTSRGWLIWCKPERGFTLSEAEMAWTSRDNVVRVLDCARSEPDRLHPTQKPVEVMTWCLSWLPKAHTILDPFMGSGTTGVACAKLGRKFIGIEIEEKYFDIACDRIAKAYDQPDLFIEPPAKPEQLKLMGAE